MKHEQTRAGEARSSQDVSTLRPGEGKDTEHSVFHRAEADTVMFASVRAVPLADDALIERPTPAEARRFQIHPRRARLSRAVLLVILAMQTLITVRMHNTASPDEAFTVMAGHAELAHLRAGASLWTGTGGSLPGAPMLSPLLNALAVSAGGLAAARAISLLEMLFVTVLLYAMTRRLFNERVALCAGLLFAVAEPALLGGFLAGYDATALCLLALAAWLVVRAPEPARVPVYLLAAPVLALAAAAEYAALFFVPLVIGLAALAAWPRLGWRALIRMVVIGAGTVAVIAGAELVTRLDFRGGLTAPPPRPEASGAALLWDCAQWIGLPFALALIGAVAYAIRPATDGTGRAKDGTARVTSGTALAGGQLCRVWLGVVMTGGALLGVAVQVGLHTGSMRQPAGFGLLLASPMAGVGLARVVGDHFRRTQIGIAVWAAALALGMTQANDMFHTWPDSTKYVADLAHYLRPGARYLVEDTEVPVYYLRKDAGAQPGQFTAIGHLKYAPRGGRALSGDAAYTAAIKAGYFRIVAYDYGATRAEDTVVARAVAASPDYRLAAVIPDDNDLGRQYVWVKSG